MRKRMITPTPSAGRSPQAWIDLEDVAEVEVTSEDPLHPVEHALLPVDEPGWRASGPGAQTIRLVFPDPQRIRLVRLEFHEPDSERTQEFTLGWSSHVEGPVAEILRQQWNFSPGGAAHEIEEVRVDLAGVAALELTIIPDVRGGEARATLARLRLA
jgi:hypothetical protein